MLFEWTCTPHIIVSLGNERCIESIELSNGTRAYTRSVESLIRGDTQGICVKLYPLLSISPVQAIPSGKDARPRV